MKTYTLKKETHIEISISENSFILKNEAKPSDGGEFKFSEIDSLRMDERINWLVSIFSFIIALFTSAGGDSYKERDVLKFNYHKKPQAISLKGCDLDLALEAITDINRRIKNQ